MTTETASAGIGVGSLDVDMSPASVAASRKSMSIEVHEITRVEGHGNINVRFEDGSITKLMLQITESPRYFESFLRGRRYDEAPRITCRVCGICSVAHTSASVKGIEAACGITPSQQTLALRRLILLGEQIQSHVLHLYFLAVPDYLGVGSVIPLAKSHPDVVKRALRMKKLANDVCGIVGGRHIHPIAYQVGGFSHLPSVNELRDILTRLIAAREDLKKTLDLFKQLDIPDFSRHTEFVSLWSDVEKDYPFYDGDIVSTIDPIPTSPADYRSRVIEDVVEHSTAKHCRSRNAPSYMVGGLARFNNNYERLHPVAKEAADALGLCAPCSNPFHNNTAQLVETVHCIESAIELIEGFLISPPKTEPFAKPTKWSRGVGAVEAPRGLLFHEYELDETGKIVRANLIIPTGQNLANIEEDMRFMIPNLIDSGMTKEQITLRLEMLVRAYDPCISCATHFLDIEWT